MRRVLQSAALLLIVLAVAVSLRYAVWLPLACEARVTHALRALNDAADSRAAVQMAAARSAQSSLSACDCLAGSDFKLMYVRGTAFRYLDDPAAAIDAYHRALAVDRRPEIYLALGFAQLEALDRPAALDSFAAAGAFSPARLEAIHYEDVRREVEARIRTEYGAEW
jgi:tetratricopeptide (TPR) repeat protein